MRIVGDAVDDVHSSFDQVEIDQDVQEAPDGQGEDIPSEDSLPEAIELVDGPFVDLDDSGVEIDDAEDNEMEDPEVPSWSITIGGPDKDSAFSFLMTPDGGFIIAGATMSFGAGSNDLWIVRVDSLGNIIEDKTYGGPDSEGASSIRSTSDGGYIVGGYTRSFGAGDYDFWVIKLDEAGDSVWQKTYGGDDEEFRTQIRATLDGGYVLSGDTRSIGFLNPRACILKLDASGEVIWENVYAPSYENLAFGMEETSGGGYLLTGESWHSGDAFIIRIDEEGDPQWQNVYGGEEIETASSVVELDGGGFMVGAEIYYYEPVPGLVDIDIWLLNIDSAGNLRRQNMYRSSALERISCMAATPDGGFILAGLTSFRRDTHQSDVLVMKVNAEGIIIWQRAYGGEEEDYAVSIQQTPDGGYIVAGQTESFGAGDYDVWILKMDGDGAIDGTCPADMTGAVSMAVVPTDYETTNITDDPVSFGVTVSDTAVSPVEASATVEIQCGL